MTTIARPTIPTSGDGTPGLLRAAAEVEAVQLGPNAVTFPLRGEETGGRYSLTQFVMAPPPNPGPPPHIHEDADEAIYVLTGSVRMGIDDEHLTGSVGSLMFVPRGRLHSIANVGDDPAAFLVILSPPGYEGFWREMAALRAHLGGPPDEATTLALQRKYHLVTGGQPRRFG